MPKVVGIIGEYNPFHNGHAYHLAKTKRETKADYAIVVISGNFVQRGNVSLIDKWAKADMALSNGIDLVIELPTIYSISSAENFAYGATKILDSLKIIDYISFGTELDDIDILEDIADILYKEPPKFVNLLNHELSKGNSFPKARENAILIYLNDIRKYSNVLSNPNNILAIEYLKALKKLKSNIKPISIKRLNVGYNELETKNNFASASAIREKIIKNTPAGISKLMPANSYRILYNSIKKGHFVKDINNFEKEIIYTLRKMTLKEIANLPDVSEGLEHSIKEAANSCNTIEEFMNIIKTKRYTNTRIQRILLYALLGITKEDMKTSFKVQPYIRVLGMNAKGKELLSAISRSNPKLNIITSVKKYIDSNPNKDLFNMLNIDINATNIYTLGYEKDSWSNSDFTHNMIIY